MSTSTTSSVDGRASTPHTPEEAAREWLSNYYGSIDTTALLLAFRAGAKYGERRGAEREREAIRPVLEKIADITRTCDNWEIVKLAPKWAREALEAIRIRALTSETIKPVAFDGGKG